MAQPRPRRAEPDRLLSLNNLLRGCLGAAAGLFAAALLRNSLDALAGPPNAQRKTHKRRSRARGSAAAAEKRPSRGASSVRLLEAAFASAMLACSLAFSLSCSRNHLRTATHPPAPQPALPAVVPHAPAEPDAQSAFSASTLSRSLPPGSPLPQHAPAAPRPPTLRLDGPHRSLLRDGGEGGFSDDSSPAQVPHFERAPPELRHLPAQPSGLAPGAAGMSKAELAVWGAAAALAAKRAEEASEAEDSPTAPPISSSSPPPNPVSVPAAPLPPPTRRHVPISAAAAASAARERAKADADGSAAAYREGYQEGLKLQIQMQQQKAQERHISQPRTALPPPEPPSAAQQAKSSLAAIAESARARAAARDASRSDVKARAAAAALDISITDRFESIGTAASSAPAPAPGGWADSLLRREVSPQASVAQPPDEETLRKWAASASAAPFTAATASLAFSRDAALRSGAMDGGRMREAAGEGDEVELEARRALLRQRVEAAAARAAAAAESAGLA
jgi:hypothetical protein